MKRSPEKQAELLAAQEAELRAGRRSGDAGAGILADWLADRRQSVEQSIENGRRPDRDRPLPLFDDEDRRG